MFFTSAGELSEYWWLYYLIITITVLMSVYYCYSRYEGFRMFWGEFAFEQPPYPASNAAMVAVWSALAWPVLGILVVVATLVILIMGVVGYLLKKLLGPFR